MTATPIPRTLALSLYGDLDLSVLDELPPGRTPIVTRRVPDERADEVWDFVRKQVAKGRQAYIVYPVIEGTKEDQPELDFSHDDPEVGLEPPPFIASQVRKSEPFATSGHSGAPSLKLNRKGRPRSCFRRPHRKPIRERNPAQIRCRDARKAAHGPLAGLRLALLHGRLDADEKEIVMRRFQRGEIDVLVATTVIEVGVDVPNATVMVVEHAERFGLAQLHQLRGRVGRGAAKSYCILITGERVSPLAEERLNAMVRTQDGFELAELDLTCAAPASSSARARPGCPTFAWPTCCATGKLLELAKMEAARFANLPARRPLPAKLPKPNARASGRGSKRHGSAATGWSRPADLSQSFRNLGAPSFRSSPRERKGGKRLRPARFAGASPRLGGKDAIHTLHREWSVSPGRCWRSPCRNPAGGCGCTGRVR
jgi:ATP-dependent DNA helicase RecG